MQPVARDLTYTNLSLVSSPFAEIVCKIAFILKISLALFEKLVTRKLLVLWGLKAYDLKM